MNRSTPTLLSIVIAWGQILVMSCDTMGDHGEQNALCSAPAEQSCFDSSWRLISDSLTLEHRYSAPENPERGENTWVVYLEEQGKALEGCALSVTPYMPQHMHGVPRPPEITELGEGEYQVAQLNLIMPGLWDLTFTFRCDEREVPFVYSFWL